MTTRKIKNICFAGGGFYGFAQIGVLKELEKYQEHLQIEDIRGVSVGSIVAAMYAVGYTADELLQIMMKLNFDELIKDNGLVIIKLYEKYGMYDALRLEIEIENLLRSKTHIKFCTFSQIRKNLTIISTNLNKQCPVFFNRDTSPDLPISKAIRMSIGYPLIMTPVVHEGDFYGDGGEFINYPITTLPDTELAVTIGITFATIHENDNGTLKKRFEISNLYDYIAAIAYTLSRANYVSQVTEKYLERSIIVHITDDINSMSFRLTEQQKIFLYECGIKAVNEQIQRILGLAAS